MNLQCHQHYDLVLISSLPSPITSRWVYKSKAENGFKARLVVQGWGQPPGIDWGGKFVPVCCIDSPRVVLLLAIAMG